MTFDLDYRPSSYWDPPDPRSAIVTNIKGELRRRLVSDAVDRGDTESLPDDLYENSASESLREFTGAIHPHWMGGEYLPDYRRGEVEIARIVLRSTTMDVFSIRARRRSKKRIAYRICNEHEYEYAVSPEFSVLPLSFGELVTLLNDIEPMEITDPSCPSGQFIDWLRALCDDDVKAGEEFVSVQSVFYPQAEAYFASTAKGWRSRMGLYDPEEEEEEEDAD